MVSYDPRLGPETPATKPTAHRSFSCWAGKQAGVRVPENSPKPGAGSLQRYVNWFLDLLWLQRPYQERYTYIYALDRCIEGTFGAFGQPAVGWLTAPRLRSGSVGPGPGGFLGDTGGARFETGAWCLAKPELG